MKLVCVFLILTLFSLNYRDVVGHVNLGSDRFWNRKTPIVCKEGFVKLGSNCYYFSATTAKWNDALKSCMDMGTTLAYPVNDNENTALVNHLKKYYRGSGPWWLGGTDAPYDYKWVWAYSYAPIGYTDWDDGQPDDYLHNEHCLHLTPYRIDSWKWNDINCGNAYRYICQQ